MVPDVFGRAIDRALSAALVMRHDGGRHKGRRAAASGRGTEERVCGIAGIVESGGLAAQAGDDLGRMLDAIRHRGPDDAGVWLDGEAGIGLGHRRLSIVDLSPAGHQPMASACGRWLIIFNGEVYNHAGIRADLADAGVRDWRGHSDTEVLLAAVATWGVHGALERAVGMFALALWDRRERTLVLARDRVGEKPLYYGRLGRQFAFASDLAALRSHPAWRGEIDRDAVALLMRYAYVPAPYSIYRGIAKLRPGHLLTLAADADAPVLACYWDAADVAARGQAGPFDGSPEEAVSRLDALLRQSLAGQMSADVPVGTFLSGGIDSSAVTAVMQSMSARPIKTFTIGFGEAQYDEADHAKAVAAHLGTDHTEHHVGPEEAREVIPRLPEIYSEPFADPSQIPTFLVARLARESVTVALSGDAGDELFCGYSRYAFAEGAWRRLARLPRALRRLAAGGLRALPPNAWDAAAAGVGRIAPARFRHRRVGDNVHKLAGLLDAAGGEDLYARLVSHWPAPTRVVAGAREAASIVTRLEDGPALPSLAQRMMHWDLCSYLPDDILTKVDRATMAVGLEARVPMLDHRLIAFAWTLPLPILRRGGQSKWPLRQLVDRYLPRELVDRPKMGFGVPIGAWLRGPLRDWAEALLAERRLNTEGFFDADRVRGAWRDHASGRRNLEYPLWNVLMFQAWLEQGGAVPTR